MDKLQDIPTEEDWGHYYEMDLDQKHAHLKFAGKTIEEVQEYFQTSVLGASECLSYMPEIPFRYYVFAFKHYLLEEASLPECSWDASDGASSFLLLICDKLKNEPQLILPVMDEILPFAEYVALNQKLYDASIEIYDSFPEKLL